MDTCYPDIDSADCALLYHGEILFYQYSRVYYALALQEWLRLASLPAGTTRALSGTLRRSPPSRWIGSPQHSECGLSVAMRRSFSPTARRFWSSRRWSCDCSTPSPWIAMVRQRGGVMIRRQRGGHSPAAAPPQPTASAARPRPERHMVLVSEARYS